MCRIPNDLPSHVLQSSMHLQDFFFLLNTQIAAEVSAPLSKTDEIVLVGDDRVTGEVNRLVSQLPPAVQALTGVDLSKVRFNSCGNIYSKTLI